jgi:hypothetical protein
MPTFYLDNESGNDNYSGTSFSLLASGSDGAITSTTFSSATANFPNNNTIAPLKNICWHTNFWQNYGSYNGCRLLSLDYYVDEVITGPTGISSYIYYLQEYPTVTTHLARTQASPFVTLSNSTQYTFSVYVRTAGRNKVIFQLANDATKSVRFNLSSGTVEATGASATAAISNIGGGWYRLSMTATSSASASTDNFAFYLAEDGYNGLDALNTSYMGDTTKGIYFTAVQIEVAASVTAYENPPGQILSIFNGSIYAYYHIIARVSSTSLTLSAISSGTALADTSGRQYYIGGRIQTFTNGLTAVRTHSCDVIRVQASPDPTSIGSATWNGAGSSPTVAIASSTNATPIAITTSATHGYSTGDTVFICDHTTNTNANGTWEITVTSSTAFTLTGSTGNGVGGAAGTARRATNCVVRLNSALTDNIAGHGNVGEGRTVWTPSSNVTTALSTTTKQGNISDNISIGANFTTGVAAYKSFSAKDLSGYQQLSFFIQQILGTTGSAGQLQIQLCSDSAGATPVNTFNIPALGVSNIWHVFTVDLATNLGSSIQSVALRVTSDIGQQILLISNIIACKASSSANSLSLTSLIGKNTTNESWYPVQSIVGTRVIIDGRLSNNPVVSTQGNFSKGYYGTTETITTYKRETIKTAVQSAASNGVHIINDSASHFAPVLSVEGGYDRTNMSTQSGISFFDGQNGLGYGISSPSRASWSFKKLGFVRYDRVSVTNASFTFFKDFYVISCTNNFDLSTATQYCKFENIFANGNNIGMVTSFGFNVHKFTNCYFQSNNLRGMDLATFNNITFNSCYINNNGSIGCYDTGGGTNTTFNNCSFNNNQGEAIRTQGCGSNIVLNNCTTSNISSYNSLFSFGGSMYLNNCLINESSEFGFYGGGNGRIYCTTHDNTSNNLFIYSDFGLVRPQTSVRYSNTGYAWSLAPTSDYRRDSYPFDFSISQIAVSANSIVTIKAWMRRTSTGLTFRLKVKGGQIAGVTNDVISYMTAAADTWEQVSLSFTPTEAGVVELLAECWGGSTYTGYIDDLTIIQI